MSAPAVRCTHSKLVPTADLKPNPENPNKHDDAQLVLYAKILLHQGWRKSLTVSNQSGFIVTGHGAWMTAKAQGWPVCPVDYQDFASKADEIAHMIADNKLAQMAEIDDVELAKLITAELDGKCDLDLTGLTTKDLEDIGVTESAVVDAPPQIDRAAELQKKWGTERGQLWSLGEHRLLCGDCDNTADIDRLMNGHKWDVTVIDPPFERDDLPFVNDPCIVFGQAKHLRLIPEDLWRFERVIDKVQSHRSATVQIGHRHAFVAQCGTVKRLPDSAETYPSIVVCEERPDHPHQKSIALLIEHLTVWTPPWQIAFDPFSGSGTTLMACENLGRRCFAVELDPGNCAVILERFSEAAKLVPLLVN